MTNNEKIRAALEALDNLKDFIHDNVLLDDEEWEPFDVFMVKIRQALQSPARPVVKPLVWVEMGQDEYMADTPLARYHVFRKFGSWFWSFNDGPDNICSSEDEAKAAAEAHWQAKIGECLTDSAQLAAQEDSHE